MSCVIRHCRCVRGRTPPPRLRKVTPESSPWDLSKNSCGEIPWNPLNCYGLRPLRIPPAIPFALDAAPSLRLRQVLARIAGGSLCAHSSPNQPQGPSPSALVPQISHNSALTDAQWIGKVRVRFREGSWIVAGRTVRWTNVTERKLWQNWLEIFWWLSRAVRLQS